MLRVDNFDPEGATLALRIVLSELQKRGHRLRHPENETADTLDLRGEQGSAVGETEVRNESEPTSK